MKFLAVLLFILKFSLSKDIFTINFIQSYIENEDKPTFLIYNGLCWEKYMEVLLARKLSEIGVRCASSTISHSNVQDQNLLFFVDLQCPEASQVLLNASSDGLYQFPYRWLVLSEGNESMTPLLWSMPVLSSSDTVLATKEDEMFLLTEIHRPSMNHTMQLTPRGYYNGSLVDTRPRRELFRRRRDLMKHPLTMANVIQDSNDTEKHIFKEDRLNLQYDAVAKVCWICATHVFQMLNATPRSIFSYRWGYKVDGQWSGMINDIKNNKADFATNCVLYTERLDVVTYTDMVAPLNMRFIFRQPPLAYVSNIFTLPFSGSVWAACAVCVAASLLALYFASKWEATMDITPSQLDGSIGDALLLTWSAVAQQGCFIEPRRMPGRIIEWVLFTALMALYAAYSANIVVLLQAPSNSIRSLAQLAASKITLAANDVDYSRFVFSPYKDPTHVEIYKRIIPDNGNPEFYNIYDGVERIRQGLFAYHSIVEPVYRRIKDTFLESEKCDLTEVDFVNGFNAFVPVKKDSPYLEMIRVVLKQIREVGIQSAITKRLQVSKPKCSDNMSAFSSVGLLDIQPVLIFMLYGIGVSIAIMAAEIMFFKMNRVWDHKRQIYAEKTYHHYSLITSSLLRHRPPPLDG